MSIHDPFLMKTIMSSTIESTLESTIDNIDGKVIPIVLVTFKSKDKQDRSFDEMKYTLKYQQNNNIELCYVACVDNKTSWISKELYEVLKILIAAHNNREINISPLGKRKRKS